MVKKRQSIQEQSYAAAKGPILNYCLVEDIEQESGCIYGVKDQSIKGKQKFLVSTCYFKPEAYQAHFCISYFLMVDPLSTYSTCPTLFENWAMHISDIAFMAFLDDTRQLVTDGVHCNVAHCILEARTPEDKFLEIAHGEARDAHLKQWLAMDVPLSYGLCGETRAFQTLLHTVLSEEKEIVAGLPNVEENGKMSPTDFVNLLLNMSAPSSPSPLSTPVLRDGSFLPILREAHCLFLSLSQQGTLLNQRAFVFNHFFQAVNHLKIHFISFLSISLAPTLGVLPGRNLSIILGCIWASTRVTQIFPFLLLSLSFLTLRLLPVLLMLMPLHLIQMPIGAQRGSPCTISTPSYITPAFHLTLLQSCWQRHNTLTTPMPGSGLFMMAQNPYTILHSLSGLLLPPCFQIFFCQQIHP
jgi:hypothetical protein